ncbi:MAG TPA: quinone-dependent dihydroorotate dehydrogenase [Acetobacteraceae bacterium]|nr:quinone-dependent dihydroorotate dehydrogenase [Acetobacteraceae bacterium]
MLPTGLADALMPLARRLEPERAHRAALLALKAGLVRPDRTPDPPALHVRAIGREFRNPIGLAAGLDKNAAALRLFAGLGFGFVEAGSVTLRAQPGNPKPRLFRLTEDRALINRMGFNGAGLDRFRANLRRGRPGVPVGANLGLNKESADPEQDYAALAAALAPLVDYLVVNVSSPNTPGLRDLQAEQRLAAILDAIARTVPGHPPLLVKIAPDLAEDGLRSIVDTCLARGVAGLIVSNTTIARPAGLRSAHAREAGGLSGAPLFHRATAMLARARLLAGDRLLLIGVGGVSSGRDALDKIMAGASLVQLYTALIYEGPGLVRRIKDELADLLARRGISRIADAVGIGAAEIAAWD